MSPGAKVGLNPGDIVLDGDLAPLPQKGHSRLIFSPCPLWRNGWMDQDITGYGGRPWSRPHCVSWGPSSPSKKGYSPPIFGPYLLWPNGWMDEDATSYEGRHPPRPHCVRWGTSSPAKRGHIPSPPNFQLISVVANPLGGSR